MKESILLEQGVVQGSSLGADDYLSKLRSLNELCVRVRALLRRIDQETGRYAEAGAVDRLERGHVAQRDLEMEMRHAWA